MGRLVRVLNFSCLTKFEDNNALQVGFDVDINMSEEQGDYWWNWSGFMERPISGNGVF